MDFECANLFHSVKNVLQASSPDYSTTLRQMFPNIQQIDSDIFMRGIG